MTAEIFPTNELEEKMNASKLFGLIFSQLKFVPHAKEI